MCRDRSQGRGLRSRQRGGIHHHTIESLKLTIGDDGTIVDPLQVFRAKRGGGIYERTGIASNQEIEELRRLATRLRDRVLQWLKEHHPGLLSADQGGKPARKKRTK
jgi:hypothetical protein